MVQLRVVEINNCFLLAFAFALVLARRAGDEILFFVASQLLAFREFLLNTLIRLADLERGT